MQPDPAEVSDPTLDLIDRGLKNRPEILETNIDLLNREISRKAARNALLPSLSLVDSMEAQGLQGSEPSFHRDVPNVPTDLGGGWRTAFNNSSPDYFVGSI